MADGSFSFVGDVRADGSTNVFILRYSSSLSTPRSRRFLYSASVCSHVSSQSLRSAPPPRDFSRVVTITAIPPATRAISSSELRRNDTTTATPSATIHGLPRRKEATTTSGPIAHPAQKAEGSDGTLPAAQLNHHLGCPPTDSPYFIEKMRFSETNGRYHQRGYWTPTRKNRWLASEISASPAGSLYSGG